MGVQLVGFVLARRAPSLAVVMPLNSSDKLPNNENDDEAATTAVDENDDTVGALITRIGFWGPLYYIYNKEPPK